MRQMQNDKGFTLIELLIVIAIIGFLASAILVAVDPVARIQEARNAKRWAEVNAMLNAYLTKQVDDKTKYLGDTGALVVQGNARAYVIVDDVTGVGCNAADDTTPVCPGAVDAGYALNVTTATSCIARLHALTPNYIATLPIDPTGGTPVANTLPLGTNNTGYYLVYASDNAGNIGRVTVGACHAEKGRSAVNEIVKVTR